MFGIFLGKIWEKKSIFFINQKQQFYSMDRKKKQFKDLIKIEWARLEDISDDIFKEIKRKQTNTNGKRKDFNKW